MALKFSFTKESLIECIYEKINLRKKKEYLVAITHKPTPLLIIFVSLTDGQGAQYVLSDTMKFMGRAADDNQPFATIIDRYCYVESFAIICDCVLHFLKDNNYDYSFDNDNTNFNFTTNGLCYSLTKDYQFEIKNKSDVLLDTVPFFELLVGDNFTKYPRKKPIVITKNMTISDFLVELYDYDLETGKYIKSFTDTHQITRDGLIHTLLYHATALNNDKIIQLLEASNVTMDLNYGIDQICKNKNLVLLDHFLKTYKFNIDSIIKRVLHTKWLDGMNLVIDTLPYDGTLLFHHCAKYDGTGEITKYIINEKKANVDTPNHMNGSETPLMRAIVYGNMPVFDLLIASGANISAQNNAGASVLGKAIANDKIEMINSLLEKGSNVNLKNNDGNTVLHSVVEENNLDHIKKILAHNADIHLRNNIGESPYSLAKGDARDLLMQYEIKKIPEYVSSLKATFFQKTRFVDKDGKSYAPLDTTIATAIYELPVDMNTPMTSILYIPKCTAVCKVYNVIDKEWKTQSIKLGSLQLEVIDRHCMAYHIMNSMEVRFDEFILEDGTRHHFVPYL